MDKLQVINHNSIDAVDSREVAEMTGENHKELLRDIRNYTEIIENSNERNFALVDGSLNPNLDLIKFQPGQKCTG